MKILLVSLLWTTGLFASTVNLTTQQFNDLLLGGADLDCSLTDSFLQNGADPNTASPNKTTALMVAALKAQNLCCLEALVKAGADVNARNYRGETALQNALLNGRKDFVEFLLEKGADPNAADDFGLTPAMIADRVCSPAMRDLLRKYKAKDFASDSSVKMLQTRADLRKLEMAVYYLNAESDLAAVPVTPELLRVYLEYGDNTETKLVTLQDPFGRPYILGKLGERPQVAKETLLEKEASEKLRSFLAGTLPFDETKLETVALPPAEPSTDIVVFRYQGEVTFSAPLDAKGNMMLFQRGSRFLEPAIGRTRTVGREGGYPNLTLEQFKSLFRDKHRVEDAKFYRRKQK